MELATLAFDGLRNDKLYCLLGPQHNVVPLISLKKIIYYFWYNRGSPNLFIFDVQNGFLLISL
jgi:hypothetical protein